VILTVRADDTDVLRGLEAGADDYIVKPFNYLTLLARIKAVLRRSEKTAVTEDTTVISPRLKIDFVNQRVRIDDHPVKMTPLEYRLLVLLAKNKGEAVDARRIKNEIWGSDFTGTVNVRSFVQRLRKKLQDVPPQMIVSKYGAGYMLKS